MSTKKQTIHNVTAHVNGFDLDESVMTQYVETGALPNLDAVIIFEEPTIGHHPVTIVDWSEEAEKWVYPEGVSPEDAKPEDVKYMPSHVRLELRDRDSGAMYLKRVYNASLQSFFKNLVKQSAGKLSGKSARQMLDYYRTERAPLDMWAAKMDDGEHIAIYFFDIDEYRKRKAQQAKMVGEVIK